MTSELMIVGLLILALESLKSVIKIGKWNKKRKACSCILPPGIDCKHGKVG